MRSTNAALVVLCVGAITGCANERDRLRPEPVPVSDPADDPAHPVAVRYWAEVDPLAGRMEIFRIHPGNVIYRGEVAALGVNYQYGGTAPEDSAGCGAPPCAPAAGRVSLYTDQDVVTYVDSTGTCYTNGSVFTGDPTCGGKQAATDVCARPRTFCGPIAIVSNVTFGQTVGAMPNPVLQVAPDGAPAANSVVGCNDQDPDGAASGEHGLCAFTNATKVDDPTTSTLTSAITGDGVNNFGCSFCYGNQHRAITGGLAGLENTIVSDPTADGVDGVLASVNTDRIVLELENDNGLNLVLTLRYSLPALDAPGSQIAYDDPAAPAACLTRGTTKMTITGASFGPPAPCLAGTQPIASCPAEGAPGTGYSLGVPGFVTPVSPLVWSDTRVEFTPPALSTTECGVTVTTPLGTTATSDAVAICDNQWRAWQPTLNNLQQTRIGAAAGVLSEPGGQKRIVVTGGRTSLTGLSALTTNATSTLLLPLPSCADPSPNWVQASIGASIPPRTWGAAYAVAGNKLWVVGGTRNGDVCRRETFNFTLTGPSSGTWASSGQWNLPDMDTINGQQGLCDATLTVVNAGGKDWLVLSGGSVRPVPNTSCTGADQPSLTRTLVLDTTNPNAGWQQYGMTSQLDNDGANPRWRFAQLGASLGNAALVIAGSASTTLPGGATNQISRVTLSATGTPTFVDQSAAVELPVGLAFAAGAVADGFVYLVGGATGIGPSGACNNVTRVNLPATTTVLRNSTSLPGAWTTLASLPAPRVEHVVVAAESTGGGEDKIYVIGGQDGAGGVATSVFEYTP